MKKLIVLAMLMAATVVNANPHEKVMLPDLRTDVGVKAAYAQISLAAENVCPYFGDRTFEHAAIFKTCRREAIESAVYHIANVRLAAYAASQQ